jgi:hypothetical protein
MYNIKKPKGLTVNNASFNEFFVAGKSLADWTKYGKETFAGSPFFGRRDDKQQEELLKEVHDKATAMVGTPAKPEPPKTDAKPDKK